MRRLDHAMILMSSFALMLSMSPIPDEEKTMTRFDRAFAYVHENEGGFANDPLDAGGPTRYGITLKTLSSWRGRPQSAADVKRLDILEAKAIMKKLYWDKMRCDEIKDDGLAIAVFDASILFGVRAASLALQRAVNKHGGLLRLDGQFGPKSLKAINDSSPESVLAEFARILTDRVGTICQLSPSKKRFEKGWNGRIGRYADLSAAKNFIS